MNDASVTFWARTHGDYWHPLLRERKRIAARLLIARSAGVERLTDPEEQGRLDNLIRIGAAELSAPGPLSNDDLALDSFLKSVLRAMRNALRKDKQGRPAPDLLAGRLDRLLVQFSRDLRQVCCHECVKQRNPALSDDAAKDQRCREHSHDELNMGAAALCWQEFIDIFKSALLFAEDVYSPLISAMNHGTELEVEFRTTITRSGGLRAFTEFPPNDTQHKRRAIVNLVMPLEQFSAEDYFQIPYVIFHEIGVHAVQAWDTPGRRDHTTERSLLREGFVDAAIMRLLEQGIRHGTTFVKRERRFTSRFILEGKVANARRRDARSVASEAERPAVAARSKGAEAFDNLLNQRASSSRVLVDEASRIALTLNLISLSDQGDAITERLGWALNDSSAFQGSRAKLLGTIRNYVERSDFAALRHFCEEQTQPY
jgi:hypothetical protein